VTRSRPAGQVVFDNHVQAQAILEQFTRAVEAAVLSGDTRATDDLLRDKYSLLQQYHQTGTARLRTRAIFSRDGVESPDGAR